MTYNNVEKMVNSIDSFMKTESMPLTEEDRALLKSCLDDNQNANQALQEIIKGRRMKVDGC
jgi:hypothetical protein